MEGSTTTEHISPETPEISVKQQQHPRSLEEEWKDLEAQKRDLEAQRLTLQECTREIRAVLEKIKSVSDTLDGEIREFNNMQDRMIFMLKVFCFIMVFALYQYSNIISQYEGMVCNCTCTMPNKTVPVKPQQASSNYTYEEPEDPLMRHWTRY